MTKKYERLNKLAPYFNPSSFFAVTDFLLVVWNWKTGISVRFIGLWTPLSIWKTCLLKVTCCLFPMASISRIIFKKISATQIFESNTISSLLITKKGFSVFIYFSGRLEICFWTLTYFLHGADSPIQDQYHV